MTGRHRRVLFGADRTRLPASLCGLLLVVWAQSAGGEVAVDDLWCPSRQASERIAALRGALEATPNDGSAKVRLAWLLYRYKSDAAEAARLCDEVLSARPGDLRANELAGLTALLRGDLNAAFDCWIRLLDHDQPQTERYLLALPKIVQDAGRRDRLYRRLERLADDPDANPWLVAHATWLLANRLVDLGRLDKARQRFESLSPVTDWMLIGPFDNEGNSGFSRVYGPEQEIDYSKSYQGRGREVSWRRLAPLDLAGGTSLGHLLYPDKNVLAYVVTFVRVPDDVNALARFGLESCGRLWVNDRLVWSHDLPTQFAFDQFTVPVSLKAGWNKLLVKVCQSERGWDFLFRLTGVRGRPIPGLVVSRDVQPTPDRAAFPGASFDYLTPMLQHYEAVLETEPENEAAGYYLASALGNSELAAQRVAVLERLVESNPLCSEYSLQLARAYFDDGKPEKALEQVKKSIGLDPANLQSRTMLGEFYTSRGLHDRAREVLGAVLAERPDLAAARRTLQRVYENEGWAENAFREAKELYERFPELPWVVVNYAQQCEARGYLRRARQLYEQALGEDFTNQTARMSLAAMAVAQDRHADALALLEELQQLKPASNWFRLRRIAVLLSQDRHDQAIALCQEALAINPADFRIHRQLGEIYQRLGRDEEALAAYREALAFKPDDRWLRKYVEFLGPVENPAFARFGVSSDEAAQIVRDRVDPDDYPRVGAVILLDHLVTQLFTDGSSTAREHRIVQILNEQGRRAFTHAPARGGRMEVRRAVVIQPDASEVEATRISQFGIDFDQLQPGSIVEYQVVYFNGPNEWMGRHYAASFLLQDAVPIRRSQWVLLVPAARKLRYVVQGGLVHIRESEFDGQRVYDFLAEDVPPLEDEPFRPPLADIVQSVRVSTIESWDDIARWEYTLIKDQFVSDKDLAARARELTADCKSRDEKIRALTRHVAEAIQYKVLDGGIFGIKPHKAGNVLQNEWGDCKDKATLLITMLAEVGIDGCYATLMTRDAGRLLTDLPSNQCNHAIVYIPESDDFHTGWWVDGSAHYYGAGTLPWPDQGAQALVFDRNGRLDFVETPTDPPEANVTETTLVAVLDADGAADVKVKWRSTGQFAPPLRSAFREPGKREETLASMVNSLRPGSRLGSYVFSDLDDRQSPAEVALDFHAPQFARLAGSQMIIQPVRRLDMTAQYASRPVRYYDYFLRFRNVSRLSESYVVPDGYEVEIIPESTRLDTPWMSYETQYTRDGNTVTLTKALTVKELTIPREAYARFQEFCHQVDQHERKTVVLRQTAHGAS